MIKLSSQQIVFEYLDGKHLTTTLTITNPSSTSCLYFKMKVSRQKYFMVKPDKGCIPPKSSQILEITLHKQVTNTSKQIAAQTEDDQFQLVYTQYDRQLQKFPVNLFSEGQSFQQKKMRINVRGAPTVHFSRKTPNENDFLSIVNSANEPVFSSGNIQTLINQTQARVKKLQQDIEMYRGIAKTNLAQQSIRKKSKLPTVILSLVSLGLGYMIGFFV